MTNKNDLISRAAAIEAALDGADDWDGGYNPDREEYIREHMAKVPAVDAVPVEWFNKMIHSCAMQGEIGAVRALRWVLDEWKMTENG